MAAPPAKICVPLTLPSAANVAAEINEALKIGDLVELRLDYLTEVELDRVAKDLGALAAEFPNRLILTLRPKVQGGRSNFDLSRRLSFWSEVSRLASCYFDLELEVVEQLSINGSGIDWPRVICSHHDFERLPVELEKIYARLAGTKAGIVKLAVAATDAADCLSVFQLLDRARSEGRRLIAIAMGEAGAMTRILGPSRGSFLTYGPLDDSAATAPGQLSARDLRDIYQIDRINEETEILGLVGRPVAHSISPQIHNAAFHAAGLDAVYIPFAVSDVGRFVRQMVHPRSREIEWNVRGLSVTAPHKLAVMDHLDWIDSTARQIGAVNTITASEEELRGYNTDADAFIAPLRQRFGALRAARCAIIGCGGAARAALWALKTEGAEVRLFARDPRNAQPLTEQFSTECESLETADFKGFDIVINATPLGTRGERERDTPAQAEQLRGVRLVYDLVYNPSETMLLREARSAGCETAGGIEMLLAQAAAQFKLWSGKAADINVMNIAATHALSIENRSR